MKKLIAAALLCASLVLLFASCTDENNYDFICDRCEKESYGEGHTYLFMQKEIRYCDECVEELGW